MSDRLIGLIRTPPHLHPHTTTTKIPPPQTHHHTSTPTLSYSLTWELIRQNNTSKSLSRTPINLPKAMIKVRAFKAAIQMIVMMAMGRNNHHCKKRRGGGGEGRGGKVEEKRKERRERGEKGEKGGECGLVSCW